MGDKEITINYEELKRIEIYCANCGAGFILDVTKQYGLPEQRAACHVGLPKEATAALAAYQRFQREAGASKLIIQFRVKAS